MHLRALLLGVILALLIPVGALADNKMQQAQAEALFVQARQLMDQGKFADAASRLEASQKLDPAAGTLLNLASCYEKMGRSASAWATYIEVAAGAQGRVDRATFARDKANALAPTLSRLTVQVTAPPAGVNVTLDGKPVSQAALGVAVPVDPGHHVIEATAPGKQRYHREIDVAGGAAQATVTVALTAA